MLRFIESFSLTDIGNFRKENEDVYGELSEENFFVLADGIGGNRGGLIAAQESVWHLCDLIEQFFRSCSKPTSKEIEDYLHRSFLLTNEHILRLAKRYPSFKGMGTTLCAMLLRDNYLIYAHIGDSRIYQFREQLRKLTMDHSLGAIDQISENRHILTKAIGMRGNIAPSVEQIPVHPGDIYFLCSDGLHTLLEEDKMETIVRGAISVKEATIELIDSAKKRGGIDNISVVMIKT